MSDESDKPLSKLEELRARMRAVWAQLDGTAEEITEAPKVVCIKSRKAFKAPPAEENDAADERPANQAIVEELEQLLERARAGEILALTYAAEDAVTGGFDNQTIFAIGDQSETQQALRHIGALELVKDILLDIAYLGEEPLEMEFEDDEE